MGLEWLYCNPLPDFHGRIITHGDRIRKWIALTFDDGPNEPFTSMVLDLLEEHAVKATFFMVGCNAERFSNTCRRIAREDHAIGNHSYFHSRSLFLKGEQEIAQDLELAQAAIYEASGVRPDLLRPPYGLWSPRMLRTAFKHGFRVVTWDNMTNDWKPNKKADEIAATIVQRTRPGSIIVLHDGRDRRQGYDRTSLLHALPYVLVNLKGQGYEFVTIPGMIR